MTHHLRTLLILSVSFSVEVFVAIAQESGTPIIYPRTAKVGVADNFFGTSVPDPYRWLEDDTSRAVAEWVAAENAVTGRYLDAIPYRQQLLHRIEALYNYPKFTVPIRREGYIVYSKNDGLQNQSVVFIQKGKNGQAEVLLDPNTFSKDGTSRLGVLSFSKDMKYVGYGVSRGGSDWNDIFIMEVATRRQLPEVIRWTKFSGISWEGNGFYYSCYGAPKDTTKALSASNENHKVYFHRLNSPQDDDQLIFENSRFPKRFNDISTTDDEKYEILDVSDAGSGKKGNAFSIRKAGHAEEPFHPIVTTFEDSYTVIDHVDGKFYVQTDHGASNGKVVLIDPEHPDEQHWKTILAEQDTPLRGVNIVGNRLVAVYLKDVVTRLHVYDLHGRFEREITPPCPGTISVIGGSRKDTVGYYSFTSFTYPTVIYEYNFRTNVSTIFRSINVPFTPDQYLTKQVFFASKDGTRIPMFIIHRKDLALDGTHPTLLYGYGGFNSSQVPAFDPLRIPLLEQGVVYVSVNLRGGGEYGERWHESGTKAKKQNVFDDFIGAAEWLIAHKYTSPEHLAMQGASNGGLLVGAVMTQRPDLFAVALPAVGVMDMLRYHRFTIGWNWAPDYGTSEDSAMFGYLYRYSPLHNLRPGVSYPATFMTTADHDDRVVPAHSFKFAATLQEMHRGPAPVLIRIETKSGHGASSTAKRLAVTADIYAFLFRNLGIVPKF
jgi:prolyl oligopeptidase